MPPTEPISTQVSVPTPAAAPTPAEPTAPAEFALSKFINDKGELQEGWKDNLVDEEFRHLSVFDKVTDIKGVFRQAGLQEKMIGKKGVIIPDENAGEAEVAAFHKSLGVPDNAEGYSSLLEKPEGVPDEYWDEELAVEAATLFHKIGLMPKQAAALVAFDNERLIKGIDEERLQQKASYDEAEAQIRRKLGNEYENAIHVSNMVVTKNMPDEEQQKRFLGKIGSDPDFVDFCYSVGKKFLEHKIIEPVEATTGLTPADAIAKAKELMGTPGYSDGSLRQLNPSKYERLNKEITELYKIGTPQPQRG